MALAATHCANVRARSSAIERVSSEAVRTKAAIASASTASATSTSSRVKPRRRSARIDTLAFDAAAGRAGNSPARRAVALEQQSEWRQLAVGLTGNTRARCFIACQIEDRKSGV